MGYYKRVEELARWRARAASRRAAVRSRSICVYVDEFVCEGAGVPPFSLACAWIGVHMSVRALLNQSRVTDSDWAAQDAEFAATHPLACELLTSREKIQGDIRRQVCTTTIVAEDGVWKLGLRERDTQMSLWVSATTMAGCWDALERALSRQPVEWRRSADQVPLKRPRS